jgi:hypothetical protein
MTLRKKRILVWAITLWAILSGCLVSDLFVCPWKAVFPRPTAGSTIIRLEL